MATPPPQIASSISGPLKKLLIINDSSNNFFDILKELLSKLPKHTQLYIASKNDDTQAQLLQKISTILQKSQIFILNSHLQNQIPHKCIIISVDDKQDLSIWIRDSYILSSDSSLKINLIRSSFKNENSYLIGKLKKFNIINEVKSFNSILSFCALQLDGGNILSDENFIMIGENQFDVMLQKIQSEFQISSNEKLALKLLFKVIIALLKPGKEKETEIIVIGDNTAIISHERGFNFQRNTSPANDYNSKMLNLLLQKNLPTTIDYINLGSRNDLKEVKSMPDDFYHIDMFLSLTGERNNNKYIVMIAKPITFHQQFARNANDLEYELTKIARQLENTEKFLVLRNPIPLISEGPNDSEYHVGMYNNCIVERISPSDKTVWLPTYATGKWESELHYFDELNKKIWLKLGYKVHLINANFHNYSKNRGSLHCITNELLRTTN